MSKLKVSLGQFDVIKGDPEANWIKVQNMTAEASRQGGHVVVFPELWNGGYQLDQAEDFASALGEGLFEKLEALAQQHNIHIAGSTFEQTDKGVTNTATLIHPSQGLVADYQKIHLFPLMDEHLYLQGGEKRTTVDAEWGQTSLAICYDLRFPELFRQYAIAGSKVIFLPAEWPHPRLEHFRTLIRARAIENQIYMVALNRVGTDADTGTTYCGHSAVIDPWGKTVIELGETEGVYTVEIDLAVVDDVRQQIPILTDRRPEFYS